jgi:LSD1 subclass zinc finger protein
MAIRRCPYCLTKVRVGPAVAYSDDLICPGCRRPLEISSASRDVAEALGLAAAAVVWYATTRSWLAQTTLGWVLPIVYAFLALSIVSTLVLMLSADLRLRADAPKPVEAAAEAGHGTHHGGSHH